MTITLKLNKFIEDFFFFFTEIFSNFFSSNFFIKINNSLLDEIYKIYCNFFLIFIYIFIFIISILTILVFVSDAKTVTSVKMDNLPNSGNSNNDNDSNESSRKRKSDGSGNEGSLPKQMKVAYYEKDKKNCRNIYEFKVNNRYNSTRTGKRIEYSCSKEQLKDSFDDLYPKYVEYKEKGINIDWDRLTEMHLVTYEKHPLGNSSVSWSDLNGFYQEIDQKMSYAKDKFLYLQSKNKSTLFANDNHHIGSNIKNLIVNRKSKKTINTPEEFEKYLEIIESIIDKKK